jgi:hypothetical protein
VVVAIFVGAMGCTKMPWRWSTEGPCSEQVLLVLTYGAGAALLALNRLWSGLAGGSVGGLWMCML